MFQQLEHNLQNMTIINVHYAL